METRQLKSRTRDPPANGGISYRAKQDVFRLGKQEHRITCGDPKWGWPKQIKPRCTPAFLSPLRAGKQACLPSRQQKSPLWLRQRGLICFVGRTGFEPATPWSQTRYSTGLNYLPNTLYSLKISALNHPSRRKAAK